MSTVYVESVPTFEIRDGMVFVRYSSGSEEAVRCMSLTIFRKTLQAANHALDRHSESEPVPIRRGKR